MYIRPFFALLVSKSVKRWFHVTSRVQSVKTVCADPTHPRYTTLQKMEPALAPCVHHVVAEEGDRDKVSARTLICNELPSLSGDKYLDELASFGAIYMSRRQGEKLRRLSEPRQLDVLVGDGAYIRIHQNPIRRVAARHIDWASRILHKAESFYVVDKPCEVPIQAGVDNQIECMQYQLNAHLQEELIVTSRLDVCTSGVTVLGRTHEAVSAVNAAIRDDRVQKEYIAVVARHVSTGLLEHAYKKGGKRHKHAKPTLLRGYDETLLATNAHWKRAALEVLSCEPISMPPRGEQVDAHDTAACTYEALAEMEGKDPHTQLYQVRIRLITGRTHQIRLQLSAIGAPIIGDSRYIPTAGLLDLSHDEEDHGRDDGEGQSPGGHGDGEHLFGPQPDRIALHCARMSFDSRRTDVLGLKEALSPVPWWHQQGVHP